MHRPLPTTVSLPGCFSFAMAYDLAQALPRPRGRDRHGVARRRLHDALASVSLLRPRDVFEACLVQQILVLQLNAPQTFAMAAGQGDDLKLKARYERLGHAELRYAAATQRRLRQYRRDKMEEGRVPAEDVPWVCDLAELEAAWREEEGVVSEAIAPEAIVAAADGEVAVEELPASRPLSRQERRAMERRLRKNNDMAVRLDAELDRLVRAA